MNADVEAMTALAQETFMAAQTIIDSLSDGQRIQTKDLVLQVSNKVSLPVKDVVDFVSFYAHNTTQAYVTRGKNGGLVKGTRPVKTVKPTKKQKVS